ncbi:MAG: BatD family protein [Ignavibacteriaceae bacterium]|nr:BatD family protein [Ignavibacteriaceae bacterium]
MIRALFVILICFVELYSQTFTASTSSSRIGEKDRVEVSFTFSGDEINSLSKFTPPDFNNFVILSGPNQSSSFQYINGVSSASITYSYYLQPRGTGNYSIGSASINYKDKTLRTSPIKIEVVKGSLSPQQEKTDDQVSTAEIEKNLFIRAFADKQKVYQGEQVTVTYKLYTRLGIASQMSVNKLPQYQGFWAEEIETSQMINFTTEVYEGKQFRVGILKKVALFPTQNGELSVTPLELTIPVQIQKKKKSKSIWDDFFNDPFGRGETVEYNAKSNTIKLNVIPLPLDKKPQSFKGAVGSFSLNSKFDKTTTKTNEPVNFVLEISGSGNIKLLDVPEIKLPTGLETFEPKTSEEINRLGKINGKKVFEFLVVPKLAGRMEIEPVEFAFFNPEKKSYEILKTPAYTLNVNQGTTSSAEYSGKESVSMLGDDIRYIKTDFNDIALEKQFLIFSFGFWIAVVFPALALTGLAGWKIRKDKLSGNLELMKFQKAEKVARKRLKNAKNFLETRKPDEFYDEISSALYGYLHDKFGITRSEMSLERIIDELNIRRYDDSTKNQMEEYLRNCDFIRFAPGYDGKDKMDEMYSQMTTLIINIEKNFHDRQRFKISSLKVFAALLFVFSFSSYPNEDFVKKTMEEGGKFYKQQQYDQAIASYQKLLDKGYKGESLYYNLGNAYYRIGKIGYAILYYEKGLKLAPGDEDLNHNAAFVRNKISDRVDVLPAFFLFQWWESLLSLFSSQGWTIISYIFFILLLIVIGTYFFARNINQQKISLFSGAAIFVVFLFCISILIVKINRDLSEKNGVIITTSVTVKSSPDTGSSDAFIIHEGLKVKIEDKIDEWFKIRLADGKIGWIPRNSIGEI